MMPYIILQVKTTEERNTTRLGHDLDQQRILVKIIKPLRSAITVRLTAIIFGDHQLLFFSLAASKT
jgi:hypothetical protein